MSLTFTFYSITFILFSHNEHIQHIYGCKKVGFKQEDINLEERRITFYFGVMGTTYTKLGIKADTSDNLFFDQFAKAFIVNKQNLAEEITSCYLRFCQMTKRF